MNHKRLEILKKEDGKWQRTGNIPYDNFYYWNLEIGEGYKSYIVRSLIDDDLKELTEQLGNDKEGIEQVAKNARKAKKALKKENDEQQYHSVVILSETDLAFDAVIRPGARLSWHGQDFILAAMDVEDFITKRLADDVIAGRIIPCATGQMPEDFTYLADKTRELEPICENDYTANNDPNRSRWMGHFILYDSESTIGYGWRATYDDKVWRWEGVQHCK